MLRPQSPVVVEPCCTPGSGCDSAPATVPLTQLEVGQCGTVCHCSLDPHNAALLRAMGLRADARIRLCRRGDPFIVRVEDAGGSTCRIGLSRKLAAGIQIAGV